MKVLKVFMWFLLIWFSITLYLMKYYESNQALKRILELKNAECALIEEKLSETNEKLKNLKQTELRSDYEITRRKIMTDIQDVAYYVNDRVENIIKKSSNTNDLDDMMKFRLNFNNRIQVILAEYYNLSTATTDVKHSLATKLSKQIQERFYKLQNPQNCNDAKFLICDFRTLCGFGCQFHHIAYCFIEAIHLNRTFLVDSSGWVYGDFEKYFQPTSDTCKLTNGESKYPIQDVDKAQDVKSIRLEVNSKRKGDRSHLPLTVPDEYKDDIMKFHGNPFVWWVSQIFAYIMRLQPNVQREIEEHMKRLEFETPCVGLHVRRTDKILSEAQFHHLDEYMKYANEYFNRMEYVKPALKSKKRVIYLATDELSTLSETTKYADYKFIYDKDAIIRAGTSQRYSANSLLDIIKDLSLLSKCDYLVCTFSSNVCRMAYGMMQSRYTDASWRFKSLDDIYYYDGQNEHTMIARFDHKPEGPNEIELISGDIIGIAGDHWNGYSKGRNHRTNLIGLFPSYKAQDIIR